jgi:chromosome transmission fidelity protein 4
VLNIVWHPSENIVSFATSDGEIFIFEKFVPAEHTSLLELPLQPAPFIHDPLAEVSGNARKPLTNGLKVAEIPRRRRGTPDSLDEILGDDAPDEDDFVVDDDGAGYARANINGNGKRTNAHLDPHDSDAKRLYQREIPLHKPFQSASTPWRGNRKYLCLNLTGFVWTVDQDTHHTVTVEFYDREFHRDFHFTDPYMYDKACLNENGTLFSCPPSKDNPATIYYRPHETWTARADWRTQLPAGEDITCTSSPFATHRPSLC